MELPLNHLPLNHLPSGQDRKGALPTLAQAWGGENNKGSATFSSKALTSHSCRCFRLRKGLLSMASKLGSPAPAGKGRREEERAGPTELHTVPSSPVLVRMSERFPLPPSSPGLRFVASWPLNPPYLVQGGWQSPHRGRLPTHPRRGKSVSRGQGGGARGTGRAWRTGRWKCPCTPGQGGERRGPGRGELWLPSALERGTEQRIWGHWENCMAPEGHAQWAPRQEETE